MSGSEDPKRGESAWLPVRAAYERWARHYATSGRNALTQAAEAFLEPCLPPLAGQVVLDLACGDGRWAGKVMSGGAKTCIGLDLSRGMLEAARRADPGLPLLECNMRHLALAHEGFDLVILSLSLSHLQRPEPVLAECARVLRPAGRLLIVDLHPSAARRGWRRSFRDEAGQLWHIPWYPHPLRRLRRTCQRLGLQIENLAETRLDPDLLPPNAPAAASRGLALYRLIARRNQKRRPSGHHRDRRRGETVDASTAESISARLRPHR